jgi:tetratricopeptide (TPR) repeat protein
VGPGRTPLVRLAGLPSKWQFLAATVTGDEAAEDLQLYADLIAVFVWRHPRGGTEKQFDNEVFLTMTRVIADRELDRALARGSSKSEALDLGVETGKRIVRHFREVPEERFAALTGPKAIADEPASRAREAAKEANSGNALSRRNGGGFIAETVWDEIVRLYGEAAEPEVRDQPARALFNRAIVLHGLGRSEEELAVYEEIVCQFGKATRPEIRAQVANALFNKAVVLGELDRPEEELRAYERVARRFGEATEPELRLQAANALLNEALALRGYGNPATAMAVYDWMVRLFGEATEPELQERVEMARQFKADALRDSGLAKS